MKKTYLLLVVILFVGKLYAQDFNAGAVVGAVASQVDGDRYGGYNKLGYSFGLYVNRELMPNVFAQMELLFKQKGSRQNPDNEKNEYSTYLMRLNYIEIPVIGKIKFNRITIEGGLAFSKLLSSKEKFDDLIIKEPTFEPIEFSGILGVDYRLRKNISVNLRFDYSITKIRKAAQNVSLSYWQQNNHGQYNNNITLALYYKF